MGVHDDKEKPLDRWKSDFVEVEDRLLIMEHLGLEEESNVITALAIKEDFVEDENELKKGESTSCRRVAARGNCLAVGWADIQFAVNLPCDVDRQLAMRKVYRETHKRNLRPHQQVEQAQTGEHDRRIARGFSHTIKTDEASGSDPFCRSPMLVSIIFWCMWYILVCHPHLTIIICLTAVWAQACGSERKTSFVIIVHLWFIRCP